MPRHPEREHSLIRLPKLPSTGNDSTAVDNSWEAKIFYVLFNKELRGAFGRTIQRPESSADHRKLLADASLTQSDLSSSGVHIKTKTGLEVFFIQAIDLFIDFAPQRQATVTALIGRNSRNLRLADA